MIYLVIQFTAAGAISVNIASEDEATINQFCLDKQANFSEKEIEVGDDGYSFIILADGERIEKHEKEIV